jgi:hypothetical protein
VRIERILLGTYELEFAEGLDWDSGRAVFRCGDPEYDQFDPDFEFMEKRDPDGLQHDFCEMNASPQSLPTFDATLDKKLSEAKFFLGQMEQSARSTRLDRVDFQHYLSAFLSAARRVTSSFENKKHRAWWHQWKQGRDEAERRLLNQMTEQRYSEVHEKGADVTHRLENVPFSKIETPSFLHAAYAPSFGDPWGEPEISLKVYYFMLGGKNVNVIETCKRYIGLLQRAVENFSGP